LNNLRREGVDQQRRRYPQPLPAKQGDCPAQSREKRIRDEMQALAKQEDPERIAKHLLRGLVWKGRQKRNRPGDEKCPEQDDVQKSKCSPACHRFRPGYEPVPAVRSLVRR
jgi:hypothetical protein